MPDRTKLIQLYQEMADHTQPECKSCRVPFSCCSEIHCYLTKKVAMERWNIDLSNLQTEHPSLPFMGTNGCVVPPHLRPVCTIHTCDIGSIGSKRDDDSESTWTNRYFELRDAINDIETEIQIELDPNS